MTVSTSSTGTVVYIGSDVSSRDCHAVFEGRRPRCFKFSDEGAAELATWAREKHPSARLIVVMEHTGVFSLAWAALLAEQGIESALCNPAKIHYHAIAEGQRSKTDKADAKAILSYALHYKPEATLPVPKAQAQLNVLLVMRGLFIRNRVALENAITTLAHLPESLAVVEQQCQEILAAMKKAEAELDEKMAAVIKQDERMSQASHVLRDVEGVGPVGTAMFCGMLDKMLELSPKQATAYFGLAPCHKQSGKSEKPSHIDKQGKAFLRQMMYMAGLAASRSLKYAALKARMLAQGKHGMVIIIAIGRRVLLAAQKALKAYFMNLEANAY